MILGVPPFLDTSIILPMNKFIDPGSRSGKDECTEHQARYFSYRLHDAYRCLCVWFILEKNLPHIGIGVPFAISIPHNLELDFWASYHTSQSKNAKVSYPSSMLHP